MHQATAKRLDLQRQVTLLLRAIIDAALTQRRIMGGDFNAALSRYGYAQSTSALYDKVDKFFQDFEHSTHGTLIESEAHTRRDLRRGSSASLDHIITWNLTYTSTCTMQSSTSKVHWVGAECNDHALISCTFGGDLLTYRKGQVVGGRPGAGEGSAKQAMVQMINVRVTTARQRMHRKLQGRSNQGNKAPTEENKS